MIKINPYRVFLLIVGFLYMILLILSFFSEVGNIFRLRTPFHIYAPHNNYLPFSTIVAYILNVDHYNLSTWLFNMLGNIFTFLPLGIIAPILFHRIYRYKHIIYVAVVIRGGIEIFQSNTSLGVFDVDDIILSIAGSLIGFSLYVRYMK